MLGAAVSTVCFWQIILSLVDTIDAENWLLPVVIFSIMFIFWSLAIILEDRKTNLFIFGSTLILLGGFFAQNIFFAGISFFAIGILYLGTVWIHQSMDSRIKLNIWLSLRLGRKLFVMAFSLVVIVGFLMPILLSGEKRILPVINVGEKHISLVGRMVAAIDSNFNFEELSTMTIDEYILKEQGRSIGTEIKNQKNLINSEIEIILLSGRADIAHLANRKVHGQEKIMDIFIEIINNKINSYFNTEISQSSDFAPFLFSAFSFFAVFSVGSFVTMFLTFFVAVIFKILLLTNLVQISKKNVQVEVIN